MAFYEKSMLQTIYEICAKHPCDFQIYSRNHYLVFNVNLRYMLTDNRIQKWTENDDNMEIS